MAKRASEGEWGGAGRQHRPCSCHRQSFESAMHNTGPALTNFRVYLTGETAVSRSFGRSEGNGTSQLLVYTVLPRIERHALIERN